MQKWAALMLNRQSIGGMSTSSKSYQKHWSIQPASSTFVFPHPAFQYTPSP